MTDNGGRLLGLDLWGWRLRSFARVLVVGVFTLGASTAAWAQSNEPQRELLDNATLSAVQVVSLDGDDVLASVSGFAVVGTDVIVSSAHALRNGNAYKVILSDGTNYSAIKFYTSGGYDFALLQVKGLKGKGIGFTLAAAPLSTGMSVFTLYETRSGTLNVRGTVSRTPQPSADDARNRLIQHNSLFLKSGYGSPIIDECGRAIGVNAKDPGSVLFFATIDDAPKGLAFAAPAAEIASAIARSGIPLATQNAACVPLIDKTIAEAKRAEVEAENARQQAASAAERAERLARQAKQAENAVTKAQKKLKDARKNQAATKAELEKLRKKAEDERAVAEDTKKKAAAAQQALDASKEEVNALQKKSSELQETVTQAQQAAVEARQQAAESRAEQKRIERLSLYIGIGIGVFVLILIVFVIIRVRKSRRAVSTAYQEIDKLKLPPSNLTFPRWRVEFLDANNGDAELLPIVATHYVSEEVLKKFAEGVRIGRIGGEYDIVLDEAYKGISRQHARLFLADGQLMIEDTKSGNGVIVNDVSLKPFEPVQVTIPSNIVIGPLLVRILYELDAA